jgi:xanthine dehydrogenase molybdenum-binding subunit
MTVGKGINRVDAAAKVSGEALYCADMVPKHALTARVLHSTIANGKVVAFDLDEAKRVPGVVKIITCFDVPDIQYPTAGHPWSTEPSHQDIADRKLLNTRVRFYGDEIAAVIAEDDLSAQHALEKIKVTYEEYPAFFTVQDAMKPEATPLHPDIRPTNVIVKTNYEVGSFDEAIKEPGLIKVEGDYQTPVVKHCHLEPVSSYAYMQDGKIVVVSATQLPHIMRRIIAQALGIGAGEIRVIKPYIGGGFGNRQDALVEPLAAYLTTQVGGRCVKVFYTREETFFGSRTRHEMLFHITTYVRKDGTFAARNIEAYSNNGAYASHAHALVANAVNEFRMMYPTGAVKSVAYTVYTNCPTAGAMRAYGIPQIDFAMESHIDEIAHVLDMDPIEVRRKNWMQLGYVDPGTSITCHTTALAECVQKGKEFIHWDEKRKAYAHQEGPIRHGVGMAIFCYKVGVYPISLETSSCRMVLNQDGSIQLQMGATEIGQGADTVFTQMAADTVGLPFDKVHIISQQDTDVTPYDSGAYASRQTYVGGMAVKKTGEKLKEQILAYAGTMLHKDPMDMDIVDGNIVRKGTSQVLTTVGNVAMESCYSRSNSNHLHAEETHHCTDNTFAFGVTFADITVDIPMCQITVDNIINVHDSGVIINPKAAEGQVHGGMSMGLGYGLTEHIILDPKTGRMLNDNMLDYKLMTAMDTPDLHCAFVETKDPTGPFGNKALGEPPCIAPAPAVRNALYDATGVAVPSIPLNPEKLYFAFKQAGLIKEED